jgi:hypothetical protein
VSQADERDVTLTDSEDGGPWDDIRREADAAAGIAGPVGHAGAVGWAGEGEPGAAAPEPAGGPLLRLGNRVYLVEGLGHVIEIRGRGVLVNNHVFVDNVSVMHAGGVFTLLGS